jgi:ATP-dependent helicase/nuclease subunit B
VITPRQTRLVRARNARGFQRAIADLLVRVDLARLRATAVLVPTRAAAEQLRRTIENLRLTARPAALAWPELLTRTDWYTRLYERLEHPLPRLTEFEREVILQAAARDAAAEGAPAPFRVRAGLIVEILGFYDALRRQHRTVDAFERLVAGPLEDSAEVDRGAERMLRQTRFLGATFRHYQRRLEGAGALDEHRLRERLLAETGPAAFRHVVVTMPDRAGDALGLWPADFDLLTRLPGLEQITVVATEAWLAAGFHERVHELLPGLEEIRFESGSEAPPGLEAPPESAALHVVSRDREEELAAYVRELKVRLAGAPIDSRRALVFQKPLPYLYLARQVFGGAGLPYQALDTLPLAAEPYAAALDLVFTLVASGYTRPASIALLKSPHFRFEVEGQTLGSSEILALDRALHEAGYLGGRERLVGLAERWAEEAAGAGGRLRPAARAARALVAAADTLAPLAAPGAAATMLQAVLDFLQEHERLPERGPEHERHLRARAVVLGALEALRDACARHDPAATDFSDLAASIRRWIEGETFAPPAGNAGVHLIDARAARYGDFDEVRLLGLVEGEWPEGPRRSIFYPASLLTQLGWPRDADRLAGSRAAFFDLLTLARRRVSLSAFALEDDAMVGPSMLLEEVSEAGLEVERPAALPAVRVFAHEALAGEPVAAWAAQGAAAEWLAVRLARGPADGAEFHGATGPRPAATYAVSAVETYLNCPFKYFAAHVLRLEEEREDEPILAPQARGRFVHEVLSRFFAAWQEAGHGPVTPANLHTARSEFIRIAGPMLDSLPEGDRPLERARLLGSPAATGLADRLLRLEAERPVAVVDRLLEFAVEGEFELAGEAGPRRVRLRGVADRIDLLADGTMRVLDYKTGRAPRPGRAIQLPVYAACVQQHLERSTGRRWTIGESGYVAFGESQPFVSMTAPGTEPAAAAAAGQARFVDALAGIERGEFPPRPAEPFLCTHCSFAGVCRKDYVGEE